MLCDVCHKNIATVHLTEIINEKVVEMHICQECAKLKAEELKEQLSISDLLGGLVGMGPIEKEEKALHCPSCHLTYGEFKKKGRLGCGKCYATFKVQLLPLLKNIHGSTHHTGKAPFVKEKKKSREETMKGLRNRLQRAIHLEEYEEAARLRDEIKNLERKDK
ncbi:MAG: UvrB/UvrC motif-containing protein [Candidatus Omnitrophota bacterium]|nr:MAG: UvrB/UvrC motif-containing protein [Candidatus Omnitrophota bacterium]